MILFIGNCTECRLIDSSRKSDQWLPGYKRVGLPRATKLWGMMNMFIILTIVLFSYVYSYIKIYQISTLNICLLYIDYDSIKLYRSLKDNRLEQLQSSTFVLVHCLYDSPYSYSSSLPNLFIFFVSLVSWPLQATSLLLDIPFLGIY